MRTAKCLKRNVKLAKLLRGEVPLNADSSLEKSYEDVIAEQKLKFAEE